jgi:hypothetical protein
MVIKVASESDIMTSESSRVSSKLRFVPPAIIIMIASLVKTLRINVSDSTYDSNTDCVWDWMIEILRNTMTVTVLLTGSWVAGGTKVTLDSGANDREAANDWDTVNDRDAENDLDPVKLSVGITVSRTIVGTVRFPGTE